MSRIIFKLSILVAFNFSYSFVGVGGNIDAIGKVYQSSLEKLIQRKKSIDEYCSTKGVNLERLVGFENDSNLVRVVNGKYPPGYNRLFNIYRDKSGKVLHVVESPIGRTDDWNITHNLYYDDAGNVFAYIRETGYANSNCTEGYAFEKKVYYYGVGFKVLKSTYELTDFYGKPLKKELCSFPYNFDYKLIYSYKEFAKLKNIKNGG